MRVPPSLRGSGGCWDRLRGGHSGSPWEALPLQSAPKDPKHAPKRPRQRGLEKAHQEIQTSIQRPLAHNPGTVGDVPKATVTKLQYYMGQCTLRKYDWLEA
ncbi:unnamed protein product [Prorocentrum cordatum]|uniref:Uncharacterized protein n=1 Tax=Prorocentrum cordatum TaxID=2364126 RepID=A0ABN9S859_9DINO|nr:unnamed protein product [Polarella glacialis]